MNKNTVSMEGKTIKTIKQRSINCWDIVFTDGTTKYLWAEIDGPLNLGQLWVSDAL